MTYFQMKQFTLQHAKSAMKVGTDGTLLGAYVAECFRNAPPIHTLDVGTGCGVVALMLAQAWSGSNITGIEIDQPSAEEALTNATFSPFSERLKILHGDFLSFNPNTSYQLIVSNPPYYTETHNSANERENTAKHMGADFPTLFFAKCTELLSPTDGKVMLILPNSALAQFKESATENGLFLLHQLDIHTQAKQLPKRHIALWGKKAPLNGHTLHHLTILQGAGRHDYSPEYSTLLSPYLTIF